MHTEQNSDLENVQIELKLVKKLVRLSRACWSPTLRANIDVIESLRREIQAANMPRRKAR